VSATIGLREVVLGMQAQRVAAALLVERGRFVTLDRLEDRVFGSVTLPKSGSSSRLRVALHRFRSQFPECDPLESGPAGVRLKEIRSVDLWKLELLANESSGKTVELVPGSDASEQLRARVSEALGSWKGDPFGELRDLEWLIGSAAYFEELHSALEECWGRLALHSLPSNEFGGLVATLTAAAEGQPLREQRHEQLMWALSESGRHAEALRSYEKYRLMLAEQTGLEPSIRLRRLAEHIVGVIDNDSQPGDGLTSSNTPTKWNSVPRSVKSGPLFGRGEELSLCLQTLRTDRILTVVGLGGMGKSSLIATVSAHWNDVAWVSIGELEPNESLENALAASLGLASGGTQEVVSSRLAAHRFSAPCLVVLDAAESRAIEAVAVATDLLRRSRNVAVAITSRAPVAGSIRMLTLQSLPLGDREHPGPAALLVALAANWPAHSIAQRWSEVEQIAQLSGGIPLNLAVSAKNRPHAPLRVLRDAPTVNDPENDIIRESLTGLPTVLQEWIAVLALAPGGVSLPYAGHLAAATDRDIQFLVEVATHRGLSRIEYASDSTRWSLYEPVRRLLALQAGPRISSDFRTRRDSFFLGRAREAVGNWLCRVDANASLEVMAEHGALTQFVNEMDDRVPELEGGAALVEVLRKCDQVHLATTVSKRLLANQESGTQRGRCQALLAASLTSASYSARAIAISELRLARQLAQEINDVELELRCASELTLGLGWSGQLAEAFELATYVFAHPAQHQSVYVQRMTGKLRGLSRAVGGDLIGGANEMMEVGARDLVENVVGDSAADFRVAASLFSLGGDIVSTRKALVAGANVPLTPFNGFSHAGIAHELARLAIADHSIDAFGLSERALILLQRYGDHRTALTARNEHARLLQQLGRTLEAQSEFAACAEGLLGLDIPGAAVAIANLADSMRSTGHSQPTTVSLATAAISLSTAGRGIPLSADEQQIIENVRALATAPTFTEPATLLEHTRRLLQEIRIDLELVP
jgi:DNA-binding SARP family transcriptional activator